MLVVRETIQSLRIQLRKELQAYVSVDAKSKKSRNKATHPFIRSMWQYIKSFSKFSFYNQKTQMIESMAKPFIEDKKEEIICMLGYLSIIENIPKALQDFPTCYKL